MSEPFMAEIRIFAGDFAPQGWAFCNGQLLSTAQNVALFSILGTSFGGDGRTTFALPDLRDRTPAHPGSGPGLPYYRVGDKAGRAEASVKVVKAVSPARNLGHRETSRTVRGKWSTQDTASPYLGLNFIIALVGRYPSRN